MLHIKETEKPRKEEGMAAAVWKGDGSGTGREGRQWKAWQAWSVPGYSLHWGVLAHTKAQHDFCNNQGGWVILHCTPSSAIESFSLPFYIISHFLLLVIFHLSYLFISLILLWNWDCFTLGAIRLAQLSTICIGSRILGGVRMLF